MTSATQETSAQSQEVTVSLEELGRTADRVFEASRRFSLGESEAPRRSARAPGAASPRAR